MSIEMIAYDPDQGQVCCFREGFSNPTAAFGRGANNVVVTSCISSLFRVPHDLAHRRARYRQRPHDLLDGTMLLKICASNLADLLHANHPQSPFRPSRAKGKDADTTRQKGSELDAKIPLRGALLSAILQPRRQDPGAELIGGRHRGDG
jgi:hypothetical protein